MLASFSWSLIFLTCRSDTFYFILIPLIMFFLDMIADVLRGLHLAGKMVCSPLVRWRVTPNSEDW